MEPGDAAARLWRAGLAAVAAGALALGAAACGGGASPGASTAGAESGHTVALLLPGARHAREGTRAGRAFAARTTRLCPACRALVRHAGGDAGRQERQARAVLGEGASVLVVDPVDGAGARAIGARARARGIPVVALRRTPPGLGAAYYLSYDETAAGALQARALLAELGRQKRSDGTIVVLDGPRGDEGAGLGAQGARSVLGSSSLKVGAEYHTPGWSPSAARAEMARAIYDLGKNGFVAVYAADDGIAAGAIAAMRSAGIDPSTIPVGGRGGGPAAARRILAGRQYMTVYEPVAPEASDAATIAVALARGATPDVRTTTIHRGAGTVRGILYDPVEVTRGNVAARLGTG